MASVLGIRWHHNHPLGSQLAQKPVAFISLHFIWATLANFILSILWPWAGPIFFVNPAKFPHKNKCIWGFPGPKHILIHFLGGDLMGQSHFAFPHTQGGPFPQGQSVGPLPTQIGARFWPRGPEFPTQTFKFVVHDGQNTGQDFQPNFQFEVGLSPVPMGAHPFLWAQISLGWPEFWGPHHGGGYFVLPSYPHPCSGPFSIHSAFLAPRQGGFLGQFFNPSVPHHIPQRGPDWPLAPTGFGALRGP